MHANTTIRSLLRRLTLGALIVVSGGCALGSAVNGPESGRLLREPPYYAASRSAVVRGAVAHTPIAYERGAVHEAFFDPAGGGGTEIGALLREMNAYLDSLGVSTRLALESVPGATPPSVEFGCEQDPLGECAHESRDVSIQGSPWMRLSAARPSARWVAAAREALDRSGAEHALVVTLEVGQYWTHQRNLLGQKEVRLGTDYSAGLPWLTSLEQPVHVLQLTGALVDRDGRPVRIGAEGMIARQTNLLLSSLGAQELITEGDVRKLREARRSDLPGRPRVWEAALRSLVAELAERPEVAFR